MKKIFRVACIGSREISDKTFDILKEIGKQIAIRGWEIASGNALGSDFAYASGANEIDPGLVHLFLPWPSYNSNQLVPGNKCHLDSKPEWKVIAKYYHPKYGSLTQGVQKMMDRNIGIIINSNITCAVLNPNKIGGGGTGHGWRASQGRKIPTIDLTKVEKGLPSLVDVIAGLEAVAKKFHEN